VRISDRAVANLQEYANLLRRFKPVETVSVVIRRGGKELTVPMTFAER
jgi:S1-C subfamily serine protease